jgi:hypothetical protein
MKIEIDQSGKIEATGQHTVVADSFGNAVEIAAVSKRHLLSLFRAKGEPNMFFTKTFALLVALTIQKSFHPSHYYLVDTEYIGWDDVIKTWIFRYLKRLNCSMDRQNLVFGYVGKGSSSHTYAYNTYKRKRTKKVAVVKRIPLTRLLQFLP